MNERQNKIIELLSKKQKIEVTELSKILAVSQVTIRKDLALLESNGLIIREHGFAKINDSDDVNKRLVYNYKKKQKIAALAAQMVECGETIMIESGSCCALLALELAKSRKDITIITNSAFIADFVSKTKGAKIILAGGEYQSESQVMVGPIVKKCVESFFVDKFFIGADGFSEQSGFTGNDYMRGEAVKDMAKQAKNVIVVTDSSKFSHVGVINLLPMEKISCVITDSGIDKFSEKYLLSKNVEVLKTEL